MKKVILTLLLSLLFVGTMLAQSSFQIQSPSENLNADVKVKEDNIEISLFSDNGKLVRIETLRLELEKDIIGGSWQVARYSKIFRDQKWNPVYGERKEITDSYSELKVSLISSVHKKNVILYVRIYDEGVAFRYEFDKNDFWNSVLTREKTSFMFDGDYKTWTTHRAQGAYAETVLSKVEGDVDRPLVVEIAEDSYVAIGEAALVDYARMKLKKSEDGFGVQAALSGKVNLGMANYVSPWRYVMAAKNPGQLLESNYFVLNLNEPNQIKNTSWIKPGRVIREVTLTTEGGLACVDFAAKNGIEYVEFDAGWYGDENSKESDATTITVDPNRSAGPLDLHEVVKYADKKGVGIIVYVNQNALTQQLDEILPLYKKWGIKGMKFGFVDVGDQYSTAWLHNAVRKAAKYELMVDIHDEYRPTGYSRTYPNLVTQEGIRGDEESPELQQTLYTLFIRMIAGAGDYTNCFFAPRVYEKMGGKAAQMAKAISIYSPWQFIYWYDRPEASPRKAGGAGSSESIIKESDITDFYNSIPTVWDDTKVLEGDIGKYAVVARKSADDWYVGVLNAQEGREFVIPMDFLDQGASYEALLYYQTNSDLKKNSVQVKKVKLDGKGGFKVRVEGNSGCALYLKKISR